MRDSYEPASTDLYVTDEAVAMTKLQIIRGLWSAIYDLLLYIQGDSGRKPLDEIEDNLDVIEKACRKYENADDYELFRQE